VTEKSWPFQEARSLLSHIERKGKKPGDLVTFQTGYGPSGAPHIGTFGEVVRTLMVMRAFRETTENAYPVRLIIFSDDYDGFRSVPEQLPPEWEQYLGLPLSEVPDPEHAGLSFASVNNSKLIHFVNGILEDRGEEQVGSTTIIFQSATQLYKSGEFNDVLRQIWENHPAILNIMLPTLGAERQATYCAFMPLYKGRYVNEGVSLETVVPGQQVTFRVEADDCDVTMSVRNGNAKLQWKADWAARWFHFDVDYEMCGKDLTDSYRDSSKICRVLGGVPPQNMIYELFLDKYGKKISKKLGNGLPLDQWHEYGTSDALAYYMFQSPKSAKKLSTEVIPRVTDELVAHASRFTGAERDNPAWHVYTNGMPAALDFTYGLLLNLAQVSKAESATTLLEYLEQYKPVSADQRDRVLEMARHVVNYARDHGMLDRETREPTEQEARAMLDLAARFTAMSPGLDAEAFQYQVYEVGKAHGFEPLRAWFQALYEVLLGESSGPRFGAFTLAYGVGETIRLLVEAASRVVDLSEGPAILVSQQESAS
jgi:lysyl-tRNA synthetase class 1